MHIELDGAKRDIREIVETKTLPIRTPVKRKITRLLIVIITTYVLFVMVVMLTQRRLLYFPTQIADSIAQQRAADQGLTAWRNPSGEIIGWKLAAITPAKMSVLIIHGNAGSALDRIYLARPIHDAASVDVYLLEYPGYGARPGSPGQKSILNAASEAFALLLTTAPIYVVSESIGTGVAAHLAKTFNDRIAGMMLFVPYDNLASVAQEKMPFLPVRVILWDRFEPATWMKSYQGPVGFVIAEKDEVIPAKFGRRLHDGYSGPKMLEVIPGAGHNEVAEQSADWWKNVFKFWQLHSPP